MNVPLSMKFEKTMEWDGIITCVSRVMVSEGQKEYNAFAAFNSCPVTNKPTLTSYQFRQPPYADA